MKCVPVLAISAAGTTAVTETTLPVSFGGAHTFAAVVVTTHVLIFFWSQVTVVCTTKALFPPAVNVIVKSGPPAVTLAGEINCRNMPVLP